MTITFQQKILNLTQKITFSFDWELEKSFKGALNSTKPPKKELHHCTEKEKFKILKLFDRLGFPEYEVSLPDLEDMNDRFSGFYQFFRVLRFHEFKEFDLLLKHAQLVDSFCEIADLKNITNADIQQQLDNLEDFFKSFGLMQPTSEFDDVISRCRKNLPIQDKEAFDIYFAFLLFSIFAHLDAIIHHVAFLDIEPICLGCLFIRNPSRSLIKLMTAYVNYERSNEKRPNKSKKMPNSLYGLHLLTELKINKSDCNYNHGNFIKRGNLIRLAQEGRELSFQELSWILNDTSVNSSQLDISKEVKIETLNLMKGLDTEESDEKISANYHILLSIWVVYWFFQTLYESHKNSNGNEVAYRGHYYDRWAIFNQHYTKQRENEPEFKWTQELIDIAQSKVD